MVNPVSNDPTTGTIPTTTTPSTTATSTTSSTQDVIEPSTAPPPRITLLDYLASVDIPSLANRLQQFENEQSTLAKSSEYYIYIADAMENYQVLLQKLKQLDQLMGNLKAILDQLNEVIKTTFSDANFAADNAQVQALNEATQNYLTAVDNYKADPSPENEAALNEAALDYNQALTDYQAYTSERNTQLADYNSKAQTYNTFLQNNLSQINKARTAAGLDPLTLEPLPIVPLFPSTPSSVPANPPVPLPSDLPAPIDYTPVQVEPIDTSQITFSDTLFPPFSYTSAPYLLFVSITGLFQEESTSPSIQRLIKELYSTNSKGGLPDAYIDQKVSLQFPTLLNEAASIGAGAESYAFPFDLANTTLQGGVDQAVFTETERTDVNYYPAIIPADVAQAMGSLVRAVIHFSASASVNPVIESANQINGGPVTQNLVASLLALETARRVISDVNAQALNIPVQKIVSNSLANSNLTPDQIKKITAAAISSANINALNTALALVAGTLKLPNLPEKVYNQVLADLNATPAQAALITSPKNRTVNTVLRNRTNATLLRNTLLAQADALGIPVEQAVPVITKALSSITAGLPYNTLDELNLKAQNIFQNALIEQKIDPAVAAQLSNQIVQFVRNEIALPTLNAPFNPDNVPHQLQTGVPAENRAVFNKALESTLALQPTTIRGFRDILTRQLQTNGLNFNTAQSLAQNAAASLAPPLPPFTLQNVQRDVLQASVVAGLRAAEPGLPASAIRQITTAAVQTALNTVPPPKNPEELRTNLVNALSQRGIPPATANQAAANAFITTGRPAAPNEAVNQEAVKNDIAASLERENGLPNEAVAAQTADLLLNRQNSFRDALARNLTAQAAPEQAPGQVTEAADTIYKQLQDALNTNQIVYDSIDAPVLTASVMRANPAFGTPREAIEFPHELKG